MAKATSNPCGLSYDHIVDIIKEKVMGGTYNSRQELMDAMVADGFNYNEAKAIADFYYKIYKRLSINKQVKAPNIALTGKARLDKKIRNLAIDYLNGQVGAFTMTDQDFDHLEEIYKKEEAADTPTLKAKYADEAAVFIQQFMPGYTNELFRSFVYAKPLLSSVFFIKSVVSNLWGQVERSLFNTMWDGRKMDFSRLNKFNDLANASFKNVIKGGIPAATLFQAESGFDPTRGRVEEFGIAGTAADAGKVKATYYRAINFLSKWSNRFNAAPDTRGIFHNAERHFYQLSKEYYRSIYEEQGLTKKDADEAASQDAMRDMELDDINTSTQLAEAKFTELGLEAYKDGKPTSEFQVAVAEYRRRGREEDRWKKALQLSKNDFWKKNMMLKSELGFGDTGIFGLKAQLLVRFRDYLEQKQANKSDSVGQKAMTAFNLSAFGFLNGAANFAEDALERVPLYAAVKLGFLEHKKGEISDEQIQNDLLRRQKDIIAKNIVTAGFFLTGKMLEKIICPEQSERETASQISEGRTQIGICQIPSIVPPQMLATYKWYRIIGAASKNDDEFFATLLNMWPVLVQSNNVGLGGAADKVSTSIGKYAQAKIQGNETVAGEEKQKIVNTAIEYGVGVGNSFLPIPSRAISEVSVTAQRLRGITQPQQPLPFAIDEEGNRLNFGKSFGKIAIHAMGNVTGINDISLAAIGANKEYAVDWLGRKVVQFRGSDITGSGIQYDTADDIIAEAGVKAPYVYRLTKVQAEEDYVNRRKELGINITEVESKQRYLTDKEYFNISEALGQFNKDYFDENGEDLIDLIKEDKTIARKVIQSVFDNSKKAAIEAIEKGFEDSGDINDYINNHWKPSRGIRVTKK